MRKSKSAQFDDEDQDEEPVIDSDEIEETPISLTDEEIEAEVKKKLNQAAFEGAKLILNMILDKKTTDASRFSAAKYAVDRKMESKNPDQGAGSLNELLEIVRQVRKENTSGPIPSATLPGEAAKPQDEVNYDQWVDSNLKH